MYANAKRCHISDVERSKFGISGNVLSFSDFVGIVRKGLMKENLEAAVSTADDSGLSAALAVRYDEGRDEIIALLESGKSPEEIIKEFRTRTVQSTSLTNPHA